LWPRSLCCGGRAEGTDPITEDRSGLTLIVRNGAFGRFWLARTSSHIGDGAAVIALLLYVRDLQHSGVAVGALLLAQSLPHLAGPVMGTLIDRLDIKRVMVACELVQSALFVAIAIWQPPFIALLAVVVVASLLDTTFGPASSSSIPQLVERKDLMRANAWIGSALNFQVAVGPLLGGTLVSLFGVRGGLGANAVSFLVSALLLMTVPGLGRPRVEDRENVASAGLAGLAYAWRNPAVRTLLIGVVLLLAFAAVDNVALVFLTRDTLRLSAAGFGVVAAAFGFGMLAISIGLLAWRHPPRPAAILSASWFLTAAGTLATGLAPNGLAAGAMQALAGVGNGAENIAAATLIQQAVPGDMLGRVFGLFGTAAFTGSALAYLRGSPSSLVARERSWWSSRWLHSYGGQASRTRTPSREPFSRSCGPFGPDAHALAPRPPAPPSAQQPFLRRRRCRC
jgi:MFS family permease